MDDSRQLLILSDEGGSVDRMREVLADASSAYELVRAAPDACTHSLGASTWHGVVIELAGDVSRGEELVAAVREQCPDMPMVVVLSSSGDGWVPRLLGAGAHHVLDHADLPALDVVMDRLLAHARERASVEQLERARQQSEARYRTLVEGSPDGVSMACDGKIQWANRRMEALFGYGRGALVGVSLLDLVEKGERERFRSLQESGQVGVFESIGLKRAGETFPIGVNVSKAEHEGEPAILVVVRDMTEQVRAREALAADERRGSTELMAEGVAQNFSNIMGVVSGYAASIAESFLPGTRHHRSASRILDATRHASHLTQQLLNLTRPVEMQRVDVGPVRAGQVIRDAVELFSPTLDARNIEVDLKRLERMPLVMAEGPKLLDVLLNLLLNAADAMPHGGKVTITCHQRFQVRRGNETGVYAIITMRDEGEGMRREQVEHAFDPFYTTKKSGNSFGLGLPVAQRQVQGWGGWIDLRSQLGKGTRVRLFLRRSDASLEEDVRGVQTVLVVDDNPSAVAMMSKELEQAGYRVLKAFSGDEALTLHREHGKQIELCVVDWIMPGTDGRQVLSALMERDPNSNILMTSGFSRDYCRSRLAKGGWGFLQKPFSAVELVDAVRGRLGADAER
jgi:two-component system cell cycle sensor histidine kinase/response regulator CckA